MRFTVTWHPSAQAELARLWNRGPDRQAIADAANRIDAELRVDPDRKAQDFYGDWLYVEPPLSVVFVIRHADCIVEITDVWHP